MMMPEDAGGLATELGVVPSEQAKDYTEYFRDSATWRAFRRRTGLYGPMYDDAHDVGLLALFGALMPAAKIIMGATVYTPPRLELALAWETNTGKDRFLGTMKRSLREQDARAESLRANAPEQFIGSVAFIEVMVAGREEDKPRSVRVTNKGRLGADFAYDPEAGYLFAVNPEMAERRELIRRATNSHPDNEMEHRLTHERYGLRYHASGSLAIGFQPAARISKILAAEGTFRRFVFVAQPRLTAEDRQRIRRRRDCWEPGWGVFDAPRRQWEADETALAWGLRKVLVMFGGTPYNPNVLTPRGDDRDEVKARRETLARFAGLLGRLHGPNPTFTEAELEELREARRLELDWYWAWRGPGFNFVPDILIEGDAAAVMATLREGWYDRERARAGGEDFEKYYAFAGQDLLASLSGLVAVHDIVKGAELPWDEGRRSLLVHPYHVRTAFVIWVRLMEEAVHQFLELAGRVPADLPEEAQFCLWWLKRQGGEARSSEMLVAACRQFDVPRDGRIRNTWRQRYWKRACLDKRLAEVVSRVRGDTIVRLTPRGQNHADPISSDRWEVPDVG